MNSNNDIVPSFDEEKDESLKFRLEKVDGVEGCLILILNGFIDTYNSNFFQKQVNRVIETNFTRLIFQCAGLNYVSSTGIGSFIAFLKAVKPRNGNIVLLEMQPKVYEVFQLLGFAQFFNIYDDVNESIAFFSEAPTLLDPGIFPKIFPCPVCSTRLKVVRAGRFRCSKCKTILAVDSSGQIFLG